MESMKRLRKKFVTDRRDFSKGGPTKHSKPQTGHADRLPGPEWSFVPEYIGSLRPGGGGIRWMGNCFNDTSSEVNMDPQHEAKVTISMHSPVAIFCEDAYFIATPFRYDLVDFIIHGKYEIKWGKMEGEELDDMTTNGVRIFRLSQSVAMTIVDTWETLQLFLGALTGGPGVPRGVAERNLKFLNKYANYEMKPVQSLASVDPSLMRSGDMIGVVRLDGLDPLIMWGTGSHLGHTAVLMRGSNGSLFVCESQSKGNYWPKDAIQRTEWSQWLEWAREADYNVVWMPLREDVRVKFNATSAMREFEQLEGLRYGFYNLIFGWIDTPRNNFPYPLTPELLMVIFALADPIFRAIPSAPSIWNEAMEKRLGLQEGNYSTTEIYSMAQSKGLSFGKLMSLPEQDDWVYPGVKDPKGGWKYRPGPSVVCDVLVCRLWKAGGLLPSSVNCAEFTPFDLYELDLFLQDASSLPPGCKADGRMGYCQVLGDNEITLPYANTIAPFPHMRERCPTTAPNYEDRRLAASWC
uniref:Uncharacterized protein n=1 Tax=Hanusia phi TaxID=3032 RepID=A0A7S0NDH2_9CRYP